MKWIAVSAIFFMSLSASATTPNDAKAFTQGLRDAQEQCTSVYYLAQLKVQLARDAADQQFRNYGTPPDDDSFFQQSNAASSALNECRTKAEDKGKALYESFLATKPSPDVKADAKQVLVAWIAFFGIVSDQSTDYHSQEWTNLGNAKAKLNVDTMVP